VIELPSKARSLRVQDVAVPIRYYVDVVDSPGIADLGFSVVCEEPLREGKVIEDEQRGGRYVVISASVDTSDPDPETGLLYGSAQVRPAD
jgi:hypothetical protein